MDSNPAYSPICAVLGLLVYYVSFISLSVYTWIVIEKKYKNSAEVTMWVKNFELGGCGKMDMTYSL